MTAQTKAFLKTRFETGDIPTESDYIDLIDSFLLVGGTQPLGGTVNVSGTFNFVDSAGSARVVLSNSVARFIQTVSANTINVALVSAAQIVVSTVKATRLEVTDSYIRTFASVAAVGSTQGSASVIDAPLIRVTNASAGVIDGIRLPAGTGTGDERKIFNRSTDALKVYPESGAQINSLSPNAAYAISASAVQTFTRITSTQWYTG